MIEIFKCFGLFKKKKNIDLIDDENIKINDDKDIINDDKSENLEMQNKALEPLIENQNNIQEEEEGEGERKQKIKIPEQKFPLLEDRPSEGDQ